MKIAIIGGGASGLMAAIAAKTDNASVTVYEKEKRVGRKILATGNGRCNLTNTGADLKDYHSGNINFIKGAKTRFWVDETLSLFEELGLVCKEEQDGKVYPYSDTASSVLDILRRRVDAVGVQTVCDFAVSKIEKTDSGFKIISKTGQTSFYDRVIIATGGMAGATLGSDGSGYALLKSFGHRITPLTPSLVQIKTETETVRKLKGIKVQAKVTIGSHSRDGELLFTDYGISGPPVFSLSSYLDGCDDVVIDMMPEYSYDDIYNMLCMRCASFYDATLEDFFTGMLNKRVGMALLKHSGVMPLSRLVATLTDKEIKTVTHSIKGMRLKITGTASWNSAQVTKGGADVNEFDPVTMMSKRVFGLYACGEVLDVDGDCGGYNLQWAWSSGYIAGKNAAGGGKNNEKTC